MGDGSARGGEVSGGYARCIRSWRGQQDYMYRMLVALALAERETNEGRAAKKVACKNALRAPL